MQSGNASNNTSKTPTDLTKQRAEDDEEKEAAIDLKEIEKFSTAKIYGCEVMIGLFQCMMDLFFQNDRVCMSNVRGKYEKWPFKSYYLLSYDRLQDVRLYGVSKETDADVDMEIEEPGKMDQLLDEASFLVFKYPLSDEDDRNAVMSFYDPTGSDILKGYIMLRPVEDATGDTDLEDIKDILRGHTDVTPIDGKEQAKEYLQNLMKDPFSYRSNGRKSGGKEEEQSSSESEEDSDDGIPVLTYPLPPCTSDIVTIIRHDVSRLKPRRYLNDNIIDYYFKRMMLEDFRANEIVQEKVLFLSSHFYSRLRVGRGPTQAARLEAGYKNVSTWLARSNFFNRSMIFIPINKDLHWSLAVIVNPRIAATHKDGSCMQGEDEAFSCIAVLDPLGSYHRKAAIVRNLRAFLRLEWETHKGRLGTTNLPEYGTDRVLTISVKAPMQRNSYDCGVYVLKFAEVMLKNCVELELLSLNNGVISTEVTDADLETLISPTAFSPDDISATRKQIRQHIAEDTVKFQELMEQKQQQKAAKASSMSSK
ncbi:hypothetical protein PHYBOEH_008356 [Phytophthora boehmeriae]|uniref:Ubiquitin-like protease family profile domain-containing protein n=1 Tax=Phytophthora boehmeriae TaxID=109152 RepID=A0A8T1W080_9STRA|nr:hypothetical protein PHYBOEH_008356 [Phytophthora boehmeriae]